MPGEVGYSLWRLIRGGSAWKGYLFQASSIWKGRDFTSWSILKKGREICHLGLWKGPKSANRWILWLIILWLIKSRKCSIFVTDSYWKDSAFIAVKRDAKSQTRYVKGVPFVNRRYMKGIPFLSKMVYKRVTGWDLGVEPPCIKLCWVPLPNPPGREAPSFVKESFSACVASTYEIHVYLEYKVRS